MTLRLRGIHASEGNPNFCNKCEVFIRHHPGGAELEVTLVFADVRGSTSMAEGVSPTDFSAGMNRFFRVANKVLINSDAYIDKLVGDEAIGLYMPYLGPGNSRRAIEAARDLLIATGHQDDDGPWVPVGVGINTGIAFVGSVGTADGRSDFTAMGDVVNVTARLSSLAGPGEILIGENAWQAAGFEEGMAERRTVELKGKSEPLAIYAMRVGTKAIAPG